MSRHPFFPERLYVGNLPYDVTEREVDELFYKFGRIREIEVKRSRRQDSSFAFVLFDDRYSVDDAIERRDGMRYGDMCLRVERGGDRRASRGGGDREGYGPPRRSIFRVRVYGLPPTASWQDLKDHMRKAGDVGFANVESRVGVVEYPTLEEMEYAIKRLDKSEFCNIFHRAQIRVERDYECIVDGYQRPRRRSHSPHWRHRSRSPRQQSSCGEREPSTRLSQGHSGSPSASSRNARPTGGHDASPHNEQVGTVDSSKIRDLHTCLHSASQSASRLTPCLVEACDPLRPPDQQERYTGLRQPKSPSASVPSLRSKMHSYSRPVSREERRPTEPMAF